VTRLAFLGTPDVALVVTAPDRRRARGSALVPTPVKQCALALGIPVSNRVADAVEADVEVGVVVAFGTLIRAEVLDHVPMVNIHFSLLPRWRGAAPVERAILAGDEKTGVCLMALDKTLDTGPVYARVEVPILPGETAAELKGRLSVIGAGVLVERLAGGLATLGTPVPQVGEAEYAAKIDRGELHLAWARSAIDLERLVRVGRAWTTFRGRRLIVERARVAAGPHDTVEVTVSVPGTLFEEAVVCGVGRLELIEVRPEGRSAQAFDAWRRGSRPQPGELLGA
jgi:methionyl-tRNA formyltransferase